MTGSIPLSPSELACAFDAEHQALGIHNTASERAIVQKFSQLTRNLPADVVLEFAHALFFTHGHRWQAYELIAAHKAAYHSLDAAKLEELGQGLNSWWTVDSFARTLSGPAWRDGLVADELFERWAHSPDLWWRRAALVSTVAFNIPTQGGQGDTLRTLHICELLVSDHADMVVKALSWALRALINFDPPAVAAFIQQHQAALAGRVKREVSNKLHTGLKYPRINKKS